MNWLGALGGVVAFAIAIASCTVDRLTEKFTCSSTSDCDSGRICDQGYCVEGDDDDCPSACNAGCDRDTLACDIVCNGITDCGAVECPLGYHCDIQCDGPGACGSVRCLGMSECNITCITANACGAITCGFGACNVSCEDSNACGAIDCGDACACDVDCIGNNCGAQTCPVGDAGACVADDNECQTTSPGCDRC